MLNTVIDYEVFEDFCKIQPKQIPIGSEEENNLWNSFWGYLKSGSNIALTNYSDQDNIFLNNLTTGRSGTTFKLTEFKKPHKFKLPKNQNVQTLFFLNEKNIANQNKYRSENGLIFGFINDYIEVWKEICFFNKELVLHNRKSVNEIKKFSWNKFSQFILPFTDVIIRDDFLFKDINELKNKFGNIIEALNKTSTKKYNILIILNKYRLDSRFGENLENVFKYLEEEKIINKERSNLSLVHTSREHDRYIFFNYLEVDFGKIPDTSTNPTKITFFPFTLKNNLSNALDVLRDLKEIVEIAKGNKEVEGIVENKLLNCL